MSFKIVEHSWLIFLTTICFLATICLCLEEAEREIFLQPRNFNPHPYQVGYEAGIRTSGNTGPVLFPETPPDPDDPNGNSGNVNVDGDNRLPIDSHPYASVVRKHKYKQAGRFHKQDESFANENPQALKALTAHAEQILKKRPSDAVNSAFSERKNYRFSYEVRDFSHLQQQNSKATNGEYRVKLPDGRLQIVSYVADKNGYKADVKYAENENSNPTAYQPEYIRTQQIRPIQIVQNQIKSKPENYDYAYEDYSPDLNSQTQVPFYDVEYGTAQLPHHSTELITPSTPKITITPTYENQIQINPYLILNNDVRTESIPEQKVEVFGNIHDQHKVVQITEHSLNSGKVGEFIGSTLTPYTLDSSKVFQDNVLSTFRPDERRYSQVHINTPNFSLVHRQDHQQTIYKK